MLQWHALAALHTPGLEPSFAQGISLPGVHRSPPVPETSLRVVVRDPVPSKATFVAPGPVAATGGGGAQREGPGRPVVF